MSQWCAFICKALLVVFNSALFLFGGANLLIGVALLTMKSQALQMLGSLAGGGKEQINAIASYDNFVSMGAFAFCAVGCFGLLVGGCGCCGACAEKAFMLYFYCILLSIQLCLQVLVMLVIAFFRSTITSQVQNTLLRMQDEHFVPIGTFIGERNSTSQRSIVTNLINTIQVWFECCGAQTVGDISESKSWQAANRTWISKVMIRPLTCCRLYDKKEKSKVIKPGFDLRHLRDFLLEPDCPYTVKAMPWGVHNKTCTKALVDFAMQYSSWAMMACAAITGAELTGILLSCFLIRALNSEEYDEDED